MLESHEHEQLSLALVLAEAVADVLRSVSTSQNDLQRMMAGVQVAALEETPFCSEGIEGVRHASILSLRC